MKKSVHKVFQKIGNVCGILPKEVVLANVTVLLEMKASKIGQCLFALPVFMDATLRQVNAPRAKE